MKMLPNVAVNFHAVYDKEWLENVFLLLKKHYRIVPLAELEQFFKHGKKISNACHITFDDGDISFFEVVYPLLQKHNIPVSIFVSPKATVERKNFWFQEIRNYDKSHFKDILVGVSGKPELKNYPLIPILKSQKLERIWEAIDIYKNETDTPEGKCINMTVENLIEVHKSGLVEIGAHTLNHPILKNETDENAQKEISKSISDLSCLINAEITSFAYPNGVPELDWTNREIEILRKNGIRLAFSTEDKGFVKSDNTLGIPRKGISYGKSGMIVSKLLFGSYWNSLKKIIKGKSESDHRREIMRVLNDSIS